MKFCMYLADVYENVEIKALTDLSFGVFTFIC